MDSQATREYDRVRHCVAFNVSGAKGRKLNQHVTRYSFQDSSVLDIGNGYAKATDTGGRYVVIGTIRANRRA